MILDDAQDWAAERVSMRTALADLVDLDGRPAGRIYRARRHVAPTLALLVVMAAVIGLIAGIAAALAIAAYTWIWLP